MRPSKSSQSRGGVSRRSIEYDNEASPVPNQPQQFFTSNQPPYQQFSSLPQQHQYLPQYSTQYSNQHPTQYTNTHPNQYSNPHPTQYTNPHPNHYSNPYMEPFSQYDTQTRSPRTPEHNPIYAEEEDEVEVLKVGKKDTRPYTNDEEECLARAYVRGTDNAEHGRDQKSIKYWKDIEKLYNEEGASNGLMYRDWKSLKNKMTMVKYEMVRYNEAVAFIESTPHTGWNEVKKMQEIGKKFQTLNINYKNGAFKFQHLVDILNKCSKFNFITTREAQNIEDTNSSPLGDATPRLSVNASNESVREYHSGDKRSRCSVGEVSSPPHPARPIGNKAAKKAAKGKGKVGEESYDSANIEAVRLERALFLQDDLDHKKQAHMEKMKVMERALLVEEKKAQIEAQKAKTEELRAKTAAKKARMAQRQIGIDKDMQIMTMDVSNLPPDQAATIYGMRADILAKWGGSK